MKTFFFDYRGQTFRLKTAFNLSIDATSICGGCCWNDIQCLADTIVQESGVDCTSVRKMIFLPADEDTENKLTTLRVVKRLTT